MGRPKKDPAAVKLGRRGGKATTQAKKAAARENGAKNRYCPKCNEGWRSTTHQKQCKKLEKGSR